MRKSGKKEKRRFRLLRRMLIACVVTAAFAAFGLFAVLPEIAHRGHLDAAVEDALADILDAEVRVGRVEISPLSEVIVYEIQGFHHGESTPFLTADRLVICGDIASVMSGEYSSIEAFGVWIRIVVEGGRSDWLPPSREERFNIPIFDIHDSAADISIEGIPVELRGIEVSLRDFGGDLRTRLDARMRPGGSSSVMNVSGDFLLDDLPESVRVEIDAEDISLDGLSEIFDALHVPRIDVLGGRCGLHLSISEGKARGQISLADFAAVGLTRAGILRGNMLLGLEYDFRGGILSVGRGGGFVELEDLGRLDITPGSFLSFGGEAPFMDFRLAASRVDCAGVMCALTAPDDPIRGELQVSGSLAAREIHLSGPLHNVNIEVHSELYDASFAAFGATVSGLSGPIIVQGTPEDGLTARFNLHAGHARYDYYGNTAAEEDVGLSGTLALDTSSLMLDADTAVTLRGGDRISCDARVCLRDGRLENVKVESLGEVDAQHVWSIASGLFLPEMGEIRLDGKTEGAALINTFRAEDGGLRYVVSWYADLKDCDAQVPFLGGPLEQLCGRIGAEVVTGVEVRNITAELRSTRFERIAVSRGLYQPARDEGDGARFDLECLLEARTNRGALEALLGQAPEGEFFEELLDWDSRLEIAVAGTERDFTVALNSLTMTNTPVREGDEPLRSFAAEDMAAHFRREGGHMYVSADIPLLDIDDLWNRARGMFPEWLRSARFRGVFQVDCKVDLKDDGSWCGDIALSAGHEKPVRAIRYYSPEGGDRLNFGDADVAIHLERPAGSDITAEAAISINGFQYIHTGEDAFCFDIAGQPVNIAARLSLKDGGESLRFDDTVIRIGDVGELSLSGLLGLDSPGELDLRIEMARMDLGRLFGIILVDNFSGKFEFLENMEAGGTLVSDGLRLRGTFGAPRLTGRVRLNEVRVKYKDFIVENLSADLPVNLVFGRDAAAVTEAMEGVVAFDRFGAGPAEIMTKRLPFRLAGGEMIFEGELSFKVPGGVLTAAGFRISGVTVQRVAAAEFSLVGLGGDIDLASFTKELGWTEMRGTMNVRLGDVVIVGERIFASGGILIRAFGGEVEFRDLSADNVFRGPASILFSADIRDISLARLSSTFGFGEISGTLRGNVKDFEYVRNNANRFEIDLRVVEGEQRYIRPEFIRDFAYVNSGRIIDLPGNILVNIGTRRRYAYRNFGIHAKLRNNHMKLSGCCEYKGMQAFMTAEWYGGVNIINENPGRVYLWKPIYDRISSVLQGKTRPETSVDVRPGS